MHRKCPECQESVEPPKDARVGDRTMYYCENCGTVFPAVVPEPEDPYWDDVEFPYAENH